MKTFLKLPPNNSFSAARTGGAKEDEYSAYVRLGDITFFDKNPNGTTLISLRNGKIVTFDDPDDVYFDQLVKYADGLTEAKDNHWAGVLDDLRKRERMELNKYAGIADPEFRPID